MIVRLTASTLVEKNKYYTPNFTWTNFFCHIQGFFSSSGPRLRIETKTNVFVFSQNRENCIFVSTLSWLPTSLQAENVRQRKTYVHWKKCVEVEYPFKLLPSCRLHVNKSQNPISTIYFVSWRTMHMSSLPNC